MAVTTWTAGQVLAAADLNDTFASKVDYALPVNAQTGTTYTFVAADAEKLTTASNGSAVTLTIPPASSVAWPDNTVLRVVNYGAGAVTIDGGSGVTVTNTSSTIAQYGAAVAIRTGSDAWTVVPFGGGDVPAAEVSSPAATGQYTDGGGQTWDYYTFTSSGTLTVDAAGFADVLVIGGGGGGSQRGSRAGGGGGAGGYLAVTDAYLPAGSLTVVVGAGGSGTADSPNHAGKPGISSRIDSFYGIGGGGGAGFTGFAGGSGGGSALGAAAGAGVSGQGNDGGVGNVNAPNYGGGGGGGSSAAGANGTSTAGGNGGAGTASSITGTSVTRGGGGGGAAYGGTGGTGGAGGGGNGSSSGTGSAGSANTGGGGGGGYDSSSGGNGGSGIVIVRVKV